MAAISSVADEEHIAAEDNRIRPIGGKTVIVQVAGNGRAQVGNLGEGSEEGCVGQLESQFEGNVAQSFNLSSLLCRVDTSTRGGSIRWSTRAVLLTEASRLTPPAVRELGHSLPKTTTKNLIYN